VADDELSALLGPADPAMVVVTAAADQERAGCLVGFHSQSSITPPRYSIWLSKANHTYRIGLRATHFAIHFLTADDHAIASAFGGRTGDDVDKFAGWAVRPGPDGVPLLDEVPRRLVGRRVCVLDEGGDHVCISLEPVAVTSGPAFVPLRQSQAVDIEPGHGNTERPSAPTERAG